MKPPKYCLVFVTAPYLKSARRLTEKILTSKNAACVNLVPKIESHYWWKGKMEQGKEVLMIIKTTRKKIVALEQLILGNHPYDTPEFIVLPISSGNKRYLNWLGDSVS